MLRNELRRVWLGSIRCLTGQVEAEYLETNMLATQFMTPCGCSMQLFQQQARSTMEQGDAHVPLQLFAIQND